MAKRKSIRRILIANRGEIALRIIRTAREMGIETVAIYSDADRQALHVRRADRALWIGPPPPGESYLRIAAIVAAAVETGCDAIHPGYGFLAENEAFAVACADAGVVFIGPPPAAIRAMGDKVEARKVADAVGVPLVPGLKEDVRDPLVLKQKAAEVGYPVMLKAAAGGGGKGIRIVREPEELLQAATLARNEARSSFGDDRIYLEKFVTRPRHVEIQIMADQHGSVVHYGERECSVQRRHQKLIEESPSMALTAELREQMGQSACTLARAVQYVGAGTVEYLYSEGQFYFMEMNTRLQVEHPVTEMRFDVDLVREQIRIAEGHALTPPGQPKGHAIEIRINAEDPETFFPSLGQITHLTMPGGPGVRIDTGLFRGLLVTSHYDSMLAKLIVHGADREQAIARAIRALGELRILGVATAVPVALRTLESASFRSGDYDTSILDRIERGTPEQTAATVALAAALFRFLGSERIGDDALGSVAASSGYATPGSTASPWTLVDRLDRLQGRVR